MDRKVIHGDSHIDTQTGYIKGSFQEDSYEATLPLHGTDDEDYDGDTVDDHEYHDDEDDDELFCLFQTR